MKKIIMLAMAIVLVLGVAVLGVSAAEPVTVDVSQFESLTEDKADPNGAWEYIYGAYMYDDDGVVETPDIEGYTRRLVIYKDVILTGENENICFEPVGNANITLKDLKITAMSYETECACGDNDVFCDYGENEAWTGKLYIEGENEIVNNYYFAFVINGVNICGNGTLNLVIEHDIATSHIVVDGPTINVSGIFDGRLKMVNGEFNVEDTMWAWSYNEQSALEVSGGTVNIHGDLLTDISYEDGYSGITDIVRVSGGELNVDGVIRGNESLIDRFAVSGGKVKAGMLVAIYAEQTGGIVELGGYVEDDTEVWGLITETYKISGGCLKSKAVVPPEDDGEDIPETISALVMSGGDGIVITEPAELISGEIIEMEAGYIVGGDLHICQAYDITVKAENGKVEAPASAYVGDKVEFKATANEGYELKGITVNGQKVEGTSFTMPAQDVEIVATFEKIPVKNPPTSDINITFAIALMMVAAVTTISIKKIKSM